MIAILATIAWRSAGCAVLFWWIWRTFGLATAMPVAALFGIALARPLIDFAEAVARLMHHAHWRDVEGRHYAYRGREVAVVEDIDRHRWVRLADVRAIVGFTASDGALAVSYPEAVKQFGRPPVAYVRDDALLGHLAKERSDEAARLRGWMSARSRFRPAANASDSGSARAPPSPIRNERGSPRVGSERAQPRMRATSAVVE